jgi:hypothetical protein
MHYQQGGGKYPIHVLRGNLASRKENNAFVQGELASRKENNAFVQGELAFMHLGALFRLNFSRALLPMVSSPFASP